jgi:hypothetical protein
VQQDLDLDGLVALVGGGQAGSELVSLKRDAVEQVEGVGPEGARGVVEVAARQAKVELDREVGGRAG